MQLLFVLGCLASIVSSGRFSVRSILDGMVSFAFVPVFEALSIALVCRGGMRRDSMPQTISRFFSGNTPWLWWMVVVMVAAALLPPRQSLSWGTVVEVTALIPLALSVPVDLRFFRAAMGRTAHEAWRDLIVQRAVAWGGATVYFFGIAIYSDATALVWQYLHR